MPMRSEIAHPAMRAGSNPAQENGSWLIAGLCIIGWLVSVYTAVYFQPIDEIPMPIAAQSSWG
jgi:hypothetical protein